MSPQAAIRIVWVVYALGWLIFGMLEVSAFVLTQGMTLRAALASASTITLPAFVLGTAIWKTTEWVTWDRGWWRFGLIQVGLALLYSALWLACISGLLVVSVGKTSAWLSVKSFLWWQVQFGVVAYAITASGFYAARTLFRLREEERRRQQAEMLKVRAELEALKGKLQPHFLFNTLHTVTALVRLDPAKAEDALLRLGEILRYVLQMKREGAQDDVPLQDEWTFLEQYLHIEKIRLGNRLNVKAEITDAARECQVPIFTLQPLVENAIHHAIAPRAKGGKIEVSARVEGDRLVLRVADDGPGADPAKLGDSPGFGLRTVRQRLETRFPESSTFQVETRPGAGFVVTLTLPAHEGD